MLDPDRLLHGMAKTLEESVLPSLEGGFARGQLYAVLEVLGALEGQLAWGGMLLEQEAVALAGLVAEAAGVVGEHRLAARARAYADIATAPLADRLREGRAIVCALIDGGHADEGALRASIDGWLCNDTLMKAMALRPSRLQEISEG